MIFHFIKITKFIPTMSVKTIFDIDYIKLYADGKRIMLLDLDNTLIPYDMEYASSETRDLLLNIQKTGFQIIIISNNKKLRVMKFCENLSFNYVYSAKKPLKIGFKKALKLLSDKIDKNSVIAIGDQIMTDVYGSSRFGIDSILVHPLKKKSEKWYTKLNRRNEKSILKRIKKHDSKIHKEIIENHEY